MKRRASAAWYAVLAVGCVLCVLNRVLLAVQDAAAGRPGWAAFWSAGAAGFAILARLCWRRRQRLAGVGPE